MRVSVGGLAAIAMLVACGSRHSGNTGDPDGGVPSGDACTGLACKVVDCRAMNRAETSISGTIFAPNGVLPLYGVNVYVPNADPGPFPDGAQCSKCTDDLPGQPIVQAISNETGHFFLAGVPAGDNIPLVVTTGKWRRQLVIPHVDACADNAMATESTRLPKDRTEGDIPRIAITTGGADQLECLVRKLGVADTEMTTDAGTGRVHLYAGEQGKDHAKAGFAGGSDMFSNATTLWGNLDKMKGYDILMFSCEGAPYSRSKPQEAMDAVKAYADFGGRIFMSHWHNVWLEGSANEKPAEDEGFTQAPAVWAGDATHPPIATWSNRVEELDGNTSSLIDEVANPKGQSFATWMVNVGGSVVRDQIHLLDQGPDPDTGIALSTGRSTCEKVDPARAERWVYLPDQGGGTQNFQFTTPVEASDQDRCGKVVFSDMHVAGGAGEGEFPDSCGMTNELTPQEKALAFMFFDIASCVGVLF